VTKNDDEQNNTLVIYNLPRTHVIRKERLRGQQQCTCCGLSLAALWDVGRLGWKRRMR